MRFFWIFLFAYFCLGEVICTFPSIPITVVRQYGNNSENELFRIYEGYITSGNLIIEKYGHNYSHQTKTVSLCLNPKSHSVVIYSINGEGWDSKSSLVLKYNNMILMTIRLYKQYSRIWTFNPELYLSDQSIWKYSSTYCNNWNSNIFDDSSWKSYTSENFPIFTSYVTYYRSTIILPSTISKSGFYDFFINIITGTVVYINENEVFRTYMPNTPQVNRTQYAIYADTQYSYHRFSGYLSAIIGISNIINVSIEVHQLSTTDFHKGIIDSMNCRLFLREKGIYLRSFDGVVLSTPSIDPSIYDIKDVFTSFDSNTYAIPTTFPLCIAYVFNNHRKDLVNSLMFFHNNGTSKYSPSSISIYGMDSQCENHKRSFQPSETLYLLYKNDNVTLSSVNSYTTFLITSLFTAFCGYQICINSVNSSSHLVEIPHMALFSSSSIKVSSDFIYSSVSNQFFMNIDHVYLYPLISGGLNYVIVNDDQLPLGLSINYDTGVILGIPQSIISKNYTIRAYFDVYKTTLETYVYMNVMDCNSPSFYHVILSHYSESLQASNEQVSIWDSHSNQVYSSKGIYSQCITTHMCLPTGIYSIIIKNSLSYGWMPNSYFKVSHVFEDIKHTSLYTSLYSVNEDTLYDNLEYILLSKSESVFCHDNSQPLSPTWYIDQYQDTEEWTSCSFFSSYFIQSHIQLFRYTFTVDTLLNFSTIEFWIYSTKYVRLYLNGKTVYNTNIEDDTITYSTSISGSDSELVSRIATFSISYLHLGENSLALAILYPSLSVHSHPLESLFTLRLMKMSSSFSRSWGLTVHDKFNTSSIDTIINGEYNRQCERNRSKETFLYETLFFNYQNPLRFEFLTTYCFFNHPSNSSYDPISWNLYGCIDYQDCNVVSTLTNVIWSGQHQLQCFFLNNNKNNNSSYNSFVMNITQISVPTSSYLYMSDFTFSALNIDTLEQEIFHYQHSQFIFYLNCFLTTIVPPYYYKHFLLVEGTLPKGLTFNQYLGTIEGTPLAITPSSTLKIQSSCLHNTAYNTSISVIVKECIYPNITLTVEAYFTFSAYMNPYSFTLYSIKSTKVLGKETNFFDYYMNTFTYCLPADVYRLFIEDSIGSGWNNGFVRLFMRNHIEIGMYSLQSGERSRYITFQLNNYPDNTDIVWTYLNRFNIFPPQDNDWQTSVNPPAGWEQGTMSSMTVPTAITSYYTTYFTVSHLDFYSGIRFSVATLTGFIVYINGHEVKRFNMPSGVISPYSHALSQFEDVVRIQDSVHLQYSDLNFIEENFYFAVEIHMYNDDYPKPFYDVSITMIPDQSSLLSEDAIVSSNRLYQLDHSPYSLFDHNVDTKWFSIGSCINTTLVYTYPTNTREYITQYSLINTKDCNVRHPSGWVLEGSNDNWITSVFLDKQTKQYFTYFNQELVFYLIPHQSFQSYRFTFLACSNLHLDGQTDNDCEGLEGIQLSSINFRLFRLYNICSTSEKEEYWPDAIQGDYSYLPCAEYYSGYRHRLCLDNIFQTEDRSGCIPNAPTIFMYPHSVYLYEQFELIDPIVPLINAMDVTFRNLSSLPNGLSLNSMTGVITGKLLEGFHLSNVTIEANNISGYLQFILQFGVSSLIVQEFCMKDNEWPITYINTIATASCPSGFVGVQTRKCVQAIPPYWETASNNCTSVSSILSISYPSSKYTFRINETISISPTLSGNPETFKIIPDLPSTMIFSRGFITGTVHSLFAYRTYNVTVIKDLISVSTLITFGFFKSVCLKDDIWPQSPVYGIIELSCTSYFTGTMTRTCLKEENDTRWSAITSTCQPIAPSLTYSVAYVNVHPNVPLAPLYPICSGICEEFSIFPTLPRGLSLDTKSGMITGFSMETIKDIYYLIKTSNSGGTAITSLIIDIQSEYCSQDGVWPSVPQNTTYFMACTNYDTVGIMSRYCDTSSPPLWQSINSNCVYRIPEMYYIPCSYTFKLHESISIIIPITRYYISSYSIIPELPEGLTFDTTTGIIAGIPNVLSSQSIYTIHAFNPNHAVSVSISIEIDTVYCNQDGIWPTTSARSISVIFCPGSKTLIRTRLCQLTNSGPVWSLPDANVCSAITVDQSFTSPYSYIRFPVTFMYMDNKNATSNLIYDVLFSVYHIFLNLEISVDKNIFVESFETVYYNMSTSGLQLHILVRLNVEYLPSIQNIFFSLLKSQMYSYMCFMNPVYLLTSIQIDEKSIQYLIPNFTLLYVIIICSLILLSIILFIIIKHFCMNTKGSQNVKTKMKKRGNVIDTYHIFVDEI